MQERCRWYTATRRADWGGTRPSTGRCCRRGVCESSATFSCHRRRSHGLREPPDITRQIFRGLGQTPTRTERQSRRVSFTAALLRCICFAPANRRYETAGLADLRNIRLTRESSTSAREVKVPSHLISSTRVTLSRLVMGGSAFMPANPYGTSPLT